MWPQIIKTHVQADSDHRVGELVEQLRSIEQPDPGLLRSTAIIDRNDPITLYLMVYPSASCSCGRSRL